MGLYKLIKENKFFFSTKYYGKYDFSTHSEIKCIIENFSLFENEIDNFSSNINCLEEYIDYLFMIKLSNLTDIINDIKDDEKKYIIQNIISKAQSKVEKNFKGCIIKFINSNYTKIFESKNKYDHYDLFETTIDYCCIFQNNSISKEIYRYIVLNYYWIYIEKFSEFQTFLLKNCDIFELLLCDKNIEWLLSNSNYKIISIIETLKTRKGISNNVQNILNRTIEYIFNWILKIYKNISIENSIYYQDIITKIYRLFKKLKHSNLIKIEEIYKKSEEYVSEYIKLNSNKNYIQIPIEKIDEMMNSNDDFILKAIALTHKLDNSTKKNQSFYTFEKTTPNLFDLLSSQINTDDYFTPTLKFNIETTNKIFCILLKYIFSKKEYIDEVSMWISSILQLVSQEINYSADDLIYDFNVILTSIHSSLFVDKEKEPHTYTLLCYSAQMLLCSSIEKILRLLYKKKTDFIVFDEVIQLKKLLSDKDVIENILGVDLTKTLGYYLSKYNDIGYDSRNKLAHLNGIKLCEINIDSSFRLFHLYISVINSLFIHFVETNNK